MADSQNITNLSRRAVMSTGVAAAGALAVFAVPALASVSQSDAKLLQLCRNWHRLYRAFDRTLRSYSKIEEAEGFHSEAADRQEAVTIRFGDRCDEVAQSIAELPAQTMQGLRAKLAIIETEPEGAQDAGVTASALDDVRRIVFHSLSSCGGTNG